MAVLELLHLLVVVLVEVVVGLEVPVINHQGL
jgi:hypothetical protein